MAKLYEYKYSKKRVLGKQIISVRETKEYYVINKTEKQKYTNFFEQLSNRELRKNQIGKIGLKYYMIGADNPEESFYVYFTNMLSKEEEEELERYFKNIYDNCECITEFRSN